MAKFSSEQDIQNRFTKKNKILEKQRDEHLWVFRNGLKKEVKESSTLDKEDERQISMVSLQKYSIMRDGTLSIESSTGKKSYKGYCISCGEWANLMGCHLIDRAFKAVCCNVENINGGCARCNNKRIHSSDDAIRIKRDYTFAAIAKWGYAKISRLFIIKHDIVNATAHDWMEIRGAILSDPLSDNYRNKNYWQLGQEMRKNGEIPQDILDEVGG